MNFKEYLPFYKRNLLVAVPVILTQAGQVTVHLADNIMVGQLGTTELAAVSFANSIFILGLVFGIGFTQGLTPLVGQSFGKGDHHSAGILLRHSLILNGIVSALLTLFMFALELGMNSMGQVPQVVEYAKEYYHIQLFSLLPTLLFFGMRQFSEGIGITKYAMYITLAANLINILLNWLLIFGKMGFPHMGIEGAAIATLVSRVIMLICFIILFARIPVYKKYLEISKHFSFSWKMVRVMLRTSIPLSFQNLVEITAFSLSAIMVGWFGEVSLAAHQIAMSMSSFSFMLALGVGAAATIRVSHQYGSGDYVSMRRAAFASIHLSMVFMAISGLCYVLFRNYIPIIYTPDPAVRDVAANLLIIAALFQIFDALQLSCIACLRALADVKIPLILSIISYYLVCLPLGYFCGTVLGMGAAGVWIGLLLGLVFAGLLFLWRFNKISKNLISNAALHIKA